MPGQRRVHTVDLNSERTRIENETLERPEPQTYIFRPCAGLGFDSFRYNLS